MSDDMSWDEYADAPAAAGLDHVAVEAVFDVRVGDSVMAPMIAVGSGPTG